MSTRQDQDQGNPERGTQAPSLAEPEGADACAVHGPVAEDLHALALVVAAALTVPLASEWLAP